MPHFLYNVMLHKINKKAQQFLIRNNLFKKNQRIASFFVHKMTYLIILSFHEIQQAKKL